MTDRDDAWTAIGDLRRRIEELEESEGKAHTRFRNIVARIEALEPPQEDVEPPVVTPGGKEDRDALVRFIEQRRGRRRAKAAILRDSREWLEEEARNMHVSDMELISAAGLLTLAIVNLSATLAEVLEP